MLRQSERAPGLLLGEGVRLHDGVLLGGNVVIHDGTVIGDGVRIQDGAVLGKPPALGRYSTASRDTAGPLELGEGATVGAGAVIAAATRVGPGAFVGDHAFVRERTVIGEAAAIGAATNVDNDVTIGARVKIQTGCYITAFTTIEDDVFVAPCVTTTNDNAMGRHDSDYELRGAVLRRACRVGAGTILLPGIEVGEEAFVAAGALVTRDVPGRTLVMGVPAKPVRDVTDAELLERWR